MLRLPPGFDYSSLFHDYVFVSLPFITISSLILAYLSLKFAVEAISSGDV